MTYLCDTGNDTGNELILLGVADEIEVSVEISPKPRSRQSVKVMMNIRETENVC